MSPVEVKVPDVGVEGAVEVIEIYVSIGDVVDIDSSIIVLESDKATIEVPCPVAGEVSEINVKVGAKVSEGDLLMHVNESNAADKSNAGEPEKPVAEKSEPEDEHAISSAQSYDIPEKKKSSEFIDVEVLVPDLGGSDQVEIIEISVSVGSKVEMDETLVVLESDKASMEIPSSAEGELLKLNVKVGDKVSEGDMIALVRSVTSTMDSEQEDIPSPATSDVDQKQDQVNVVQVNKPEAVQPEAVSSAGLSVHAGPAVRKYARELGVDLNQVTPTGPKNRVTKEDLQTYIKSAVSVAQNQQSGTGIGGLEDIKLPDFSSFGEIELRGMDKIQRLTAEKMRSSWLTVPHVTQFEEADITDMDAFRKQQKSKAEEKGLKLTPVAFLLKACAYALRALPQFNISLDMSNHQIIQKNYVHIGLAVDTPNGLVVPVIRDVDTKNLWQIAEECQSLVIKAKDRKLTPADMQGGCFTISSLGGLGGTAFTPIVNTPEVAILGVSKAQYKPVFDGQEFVPRLMLPLSLSYDHRAVNGADAARFTSILGRVLSDLRELLL